MCQISSLMAATDDPLAEFSSFVNFEERKRKSNLLMSFPKIVHQKGSFGQIRKNPSFRFCQPICDIFGLTLLNIPMKHCFSSLIHYLKSHPWSIYISICIFLFIHNVNLILLTLLLVIHVYSMISNNITGSDC